MRSDELESMLRAGTTPRTDIAIDLGNTSMRLVSNLDGFAGARFFSASARIDRPSLIAQELWCIDDPGGTLRARIAAAQSVQTYRTQCFERGYYATDHFGTPVVFHRFANRYYAIGERLEHVVWPYFTKFFIFKKSLEAGQLFLKAACVAFDGNGVLIIGRGSGGKTSLVQELCRNGGTLVTNSHAVVDSRHMLTGVRSTMRVRAGIEKGSPPGSIPALRAGETLIDPFERPEGRGAPTVVLKRLCIVDYRPDRDEGIRRVEPEIAQGFVEQFALGLNVYRLEEEMLEFHDHDIAAFGKSFAAMRARIQSLLQSLPCHVVRTDSFDAGNLARLLDLIGAGERDPQ